MQSFSFKTAKLGGRVSVEVDRRWVRLVGPRGQVHIDFNLLDSVHYWVTQSREVALTGHLVLKDKQGRKLALQCADFGVGKDMVEFLRASSAILAAIGELRPDFLAMPEATPFHRRLLAVVAPLAFIVIGGAIMVFDTERDPITKAAGLGVAAVFGAGFVLFTYGPFRKKAPAIRCADLARSIEVQAG